MLLDGTDAWIMFVIWRRFSLPCFFRKRKRLLKKCIGTEEMICKDYMLASGVSFCVFSVAA